MLGVGRWRDGRVDQHLGAEALPQRGARGAELREARVHRVVVGAGNDDHILLRIDARRQRPQELRGIEDVDVEIDGDHHLRMLVLGGERRQQQVLGLAVGARRHLHHQSEDAGQRHHVVQVRPAADILEAAKDRRAHRDLVEDAALHLGAVLQVLEDGVVAPGHAVVLDDRDSCPCPVT